MVDIDARIKTVTAGLHHRLLVISLASWSFLSILAQGEILELLVERVDQLRCLHLLPILALPGNAFLNRRFLFRQRLVH